MCSLFSRKKKIKQPTQMGQKPDLMLIFHHLKLIFFFLDVWMQPNLSFCSVYRQRTNHFSSHGQPRPLQPPPPFPGLQWPRGFTRGGRLLGRCGFLSWCWHNLVPGQGHWAPTGCDPAASNPHPLKPPCNHRSTPPSAPSEILLSMMWKQRFRNTRGCHTLLNGP